MLGLAAEGDISSVIDCVVFKITDSIVYWSSYTWNDQARNGGGSAESDNGENGEHGGMSGGIERMW